MRTIGNINSPEAHIQNGVPQGTVLDLILFFMYLRT